jgi:hypothetical protein
LRMSLDPTRQNQENKFSNALLFITFVVPFFPARMNRFFTEANSLTAYFVYWHI